MPHDARTPTADTGAQTPGARGVFGTALRWTLDVVLNGAVALIMTAR